MLHCQITYIIQGLDSRQKLIMVAFSRFMGLEMILCMASLKSNFQLLISDMYNALNNIVYSDYYTWSYFLENVIVPIKSKSVW